MTYKFGAQFQFCHKLFVIWFANFKFVSTNSVLCTKLWPTNSVFKLCSANSVLQIGHVRYINILAWPRGFRVKICKFFYFLLSLNSPKRLGYKENNTKYRILTRKPRSHVRILIYRTWPIPCYKFRSLVSCTQSFTHPEAWELEIVAQSFTCRPGENLFDRSFISQLIHQLIRQIENSNPSDTGDIDGILFRADWLYNCFIVRYFWCRVVRHVLGMTFCSLTETGVTKTQTPKTQSPRN